ncbi:enoyl-CoA hydratase/isomerase family protein [Agrobacterium sp. 22-222-1]
MNDEILFEAVGRVARITLNRPHVLNAWTSAMRNHLIAAFERAENDDSIRAIVLTGAGTAFGAGQDLQETRTFSADRAAEWVVEWDRLYTCARSLSKPIVVALNGLAVGSAFQLTLVCDIRIGHAGVKMGQPEIDVGIPSTTGPWIMREIIGLARTIELTLTGRLVDALEAERIGLINRIVDADQVQKEAMRLAQMLGEKPPIAMRLNRQRFCEMTTPGLHDAVEAGIRNQREAYLSGEPAREMEKFLSKRAARAKGEGEPASTANRG